MNNFNCNLNHYTNRQGIKFISFLVLTHFFVYVPNLLYKFTDSNGFTGTIPSAIGLLTGLNYLDLSKLELFELKTISFYR